MNKKEVAEIKKQFKLNNNICAFSKILTSYVDAEKNTKFIKKSTFLNLPEIEVLMYIDMFKKTLSGSIGKNILEFSFPVVNNENSEENMFLYNLKNSKLEDDDLNESFIKKIVNGFDFAGPYYISSIYGSYSIPVKGKNNDSDSEDSLDVYDFILTSICPVLSMGRGLCFSSEKNSVEKNYDTELEVSKPLHGFLFPAFNDRQTDINNVVYYTSQPKEPSKSIIENILGCSFKLSSDIQKEKFNNMLQRVLGDDNTYNITSSIHSRIKEIIDNNTMETEPVELGSAEIKKILEDSGVDEMNLEEFDDIYEEEVGENVSLAAVNITNESAMKVDSPDIKVSIKPNASNKVSAKMVDGKRCLVIALDENVEVNGLDVMVK